MSASIKLYCCFSFVAITHLSLFSQDFSYGFYAGAGYSWRSTAITGNDELCISCLSSPHEAIVNNILEYRRIESGMIGGFMSFKRHGLFLESVRRGYELEIFQDSEYYFDNQHDGPNTPNWNVIRYQLHYLEMRYAYKLTDKKMMIEIGLCGSYVINRDGEMSVLYREMYENGEIVSSIRYILNRRSDKIDFFDFGVSADISLKANSIVRPFIKGYFGLNDISRRLAATGSHANLVSFHAGIKYVVRE
jgi:hypothetical protein